VTRDRIRPWNDQFGSLGLTHDLCERTGGPAVELGSSLEGGRLRPLAESNVESWLLLNAEGQLGCVGKMICGTVLSCLQR
jgi:hypothetical protein